MVELGLFGGAGEGGQGGGAALDDGGHVIKVAGAHFLLMGDEGCLLYTSDAADE